MRHGKVDSTDDFTRRGLNELKAWLEPWFKSRAAKGLTGDPTPPFTHDYGTGAISGPALGDPALVADVHLTPSRQYSVSELYAGFHGSPVHAGTLYGRDWIVRVGDDGIIYLSNVEVVEGDDSTFYRDNEQVTLGDRSVAVVDNARIQAGDDADLIVNNADVAATGGLVRLSTEIATVAGVGSTVAWADQRITGTAGATSTGLFLRVRAHGGGDASGIDIQMRAQEGGEARGLRVRHDTFLTEPDRFLAADFEDGPVHLAPLAAEPPDPSAYAGLVGTPGGILYVVDNAGTLELRVNLNGNVTTLATG